jgi:hypothetical protein
MTTSTTETKKTQGKNVAVTTHKKARPKKDAVETSNKGKRSR